MPALPVELVVYTAVCPGMKDDKLLTRVPELLCSGPVLDDGVAAVYRAVCRPSGSSGHAIAQAAE